MQNRSAIAAIAAISLASSSASAAQLPAQRTDAGSTTCSRITDFPTEEWGPAKADGWDLPKLGEARDLFNSLESAAVMVVHRGRLVASWGDVGTKYTAQSVRKALLNSLAGIAVNDRRVGINDTLLKLGIDDTRPALTDAERQSTFRDLLMSRSGIFHPAIYEVGGWKRTRAALAKAKLSNPERFRPGAYWIYNNWDFNAVGSILESAFGEPLGVTFAARIAKPLRMQDFAPADVEYASKEDRTEQRFTNWSEHRAYVFNISTRDLARYGLLYLNCGRWGANQVVPRSWVIESVNGVDTRIGRGPDELETEFGDYGYLWQIDRKGSRRLSTLPTREPVYMATGNRGHFMIVAPYLDLVIAHQVATVGGLSEAAQIKRAVEGSPEVSEEDLAKLFRAIIEAHPNSATAWERP